GESFNLELILEDLPDGIDITSEGLKIGAADQDINDEDLPGKEAYYWMTGEDGQGNKMHASAWFTVDQSNIQSVPFLWTPKSK
ncbi:MAG: hypothetical protein ABI002_00395, partial [Saprospiraceae bacterium]